TQAITTYLAVANVTATLDFLETVMGFSRGVALADTDGQLRYAEVRHGDAVVMLVRRGDPLSTSQGAHALYAYVADVDRVLAQARDAGAAVGEVEDKPWGDRVGTVTDPDGYRWLLATFTKLAPFKDA
ncbi:MAG: VOC family protein, partial [Vicinamibacterales bacterium]